MYLAIDTSNEFASLALSEDGEVAAELNWRCNLDHTAQSSLALDFLIRQQHIELGELSGLVVARGPGSYNGLRVGLSMAKGLAFSLGIPLAGVGTLEVEAYQYADRGLPVCPVISAGRGEVAVALFDKADGVWKRLSAEHVTTVSELCRNTDRQTLFCGAYLAKIGGELREGLGGKAIFVSASDRLRRGAYLLELGARRLQAGDADDPATLQPLYLRSPEITPPKGPVRTAETSVDVSAFLI